MKLKLLVKRAKKGDREALVELIMLEKDDYYRLSLSYMKNEDDAMDCLQDMIVKVYDNIGFLRKSSSFYSWSKTILVNICKDSLKNQKRLVSIEKLEEQGWEDDMGEALRVEEILARLGPIYREVIYLKYILDYDYRSIGELLGIPLGTVKSRIHNGMEKLRVEMEVNGDE